MTSGPVDGAPEPREDSAPAASGAPAPDTAMATGSGEGTPGERAAVAPGDEVAAAVQDDAPLPPSAAGRPEDGPADAGEDEMTPQFREP